MADHDMKPTKFSAQLPYPKPQVERRNPYYANILLEDYAGIVSELTAITLYSFQHFTSFDEYEDFSEMISDIARAEMMHLELLGKTIGLLGIKPVFRSSDFTNRSFWSAHYMDYDTAIECMLKADAESEEAAIRNYKYHISLINDKHIKDLLSRIILDEETHLKHFREMCKKYCKRTHSD